MATLSSGEADERLRRLAGWQRSGDEIRKEFKFKDFKEAMIFVNRVADAANAADHHPDITVSYNRVTMALSTHSEGGLTEKDFALAAKIDDAA